MLYACIATNQIDISGNKFYIYNNQFNILHGLAWFLNGKFNYEDNYFYISFGETVKHMWDVLRFEYQSPNKYNCFMSISVDGEKYTGEWYYRITKDENDVKHYWYLDSDGVTEVELLPTQFRNPYIDSNKFNLKSLINITFGGTNKEMLLQWNDDNNMVNKNILIEYKITT